jgi:hypothetical protein
LDLGDTNYESRILTVNYASTIKESNNTFYRITIVKSRIKRKIRKRLGSRTYKSNWYKELRLTPLIGILACGIVLLLIGVFLKMNGIIASGVVTPRGGPEIEGFLSGDVVILMGILIIGFSIYLIRKRGK